MSLELVLKNKNVQEKRCGFVACFVCMTIWQWIQKRRLFCSLLSMVNCYKIVMQRRRNECVINGLQHCEIAGINFHFHYFLGFSFTSEILFVALIEVLKNKKNVLLIEEFNWVFKSLILFLPLRLLPPDVVTSNANKKRSILPLNN